MRSITSTGIAEPNLKAIRAFLINATVPLVYHSDNVTGVQGTGCLFEQSGALYFVTAKHVLEGIDSSKLGVPFRQHDGEVFTLGSGVVGLSRCDKIDVAGYRIEDAVIAKKLSGQ
jgi:hypothetical protein